MKTCSPTQILALSAALVGASQAQTKITLTVTAFPDLDQAIRANQAAWQKLHPDVTIKLQSVGFDDYHDMLTLVLATGSGATDVEAVEIGYIGKFAEGGGLEDLNKAPYTAGQYKKLITPFSIAQATSSDGRFVAMPTDIGPGTMFYRNDILQKAGVLPSALTRSWNSYIATCKVIKQKTGAFCIGTATSLASVVIRTNLKAGDGLYFDKMGNVLVSPDNARFVRAFTLAKQARDAGLDAKIDEWTNEWYDGLQKGTFATQFSGAWLQEQFHNWITPDKAKVWRIQNLPENGYASWGGSFWAIPSQGHQKALAWEFVKFMTLKQQSQITSFKSIGAFPALLSAQNDPAFTEPISFLGGQKARLIWRDAARRTPPLAVNKHDSVAESIVMSALRSVLVEGKGIRAALADARDQIERRVER